MNLVKIANLPLLSDGDSLIAQSIAESMGIELVVKWAGVISRIKEYVSTRLATPWPVVVIYAYPIEAVIDQAIPINWGPSIPAYERVRGFSVFGSIHENHTDCWSPFDRSVVHACKLGGMFPLSHIVLHEFFHHHLYREEGVEEERHQLLDTEQEIATRTQNYLDSIPKNLLMGDYGQDFRALDICTRERRLNATRRVMASKYVTGVHWAG